MTQDKRLEDVIWTADAVIDSGYEHVTIGAADWKIISAALKDRQAYERGQVDMRERAAVAARDDDGDFTVYSIDSNTVIAQRVAKEAERAIRSLPIDSAGKDGK